MKKFLKIWLIFGMLFGASCASLSSEDTQLIEGMKGKTIYNRVGMHAEDKGDTATLYSTNFYSLPLYWPPNSTFSLVEANGKNIILVDSKTQKKLQIVFNKKHSLMSVGEYLDQQFSTKEISLDKLIGSDLDLIKQGRYEKGMSKEAFILSIGYPPRSLTPDHRGDVLTYQAKRFNNTKFFFKDGKLDNIQE